MLADDILVCICYIGTNTLSMFFFLLYIKKLMGIFKDCGCGCGGAKAQQKFLISVMSALVFFVISNPDTYRLTRSIFGKWVSGPTGCPSMSGLVLHTVVFVLITYAMMNIKKEGYAIMENDMVVTGPAPGPSPEMDVSDEMREAPPAMVDVPEPLPGFSEAQYDMFDSGSHLAPLDVMGGEVDKPVTLKVKVKEQVSCQCDDGKRITISG
ncbi:hypothetical protein OAH93_01580 [Flavobacteriales bacterium]|nr:hypothetical protein [Flavobacteriales bacterium]